MTTSSTVSRTFSEALERVASEVVAPRAESIDADAAFPTDAIAALADSGLLGVMAGGEAGGLGAGPRGAATVVERLARECGSTAMVTCMHFAASAVVEALGPDHLRRQLAAGSMLGTLAFSETGSRSEFWAPTSSAREVSGGIQLDAQKSWVTSASHADLYVWSSRPVAAEGLSTLWAVPADTPGLTPGARFDGVGLRGNDSTPVTAAGAVVDPTACLGADGGGFEIMMQTVLPVFNAMIAATSIGLMEGVTSRTAAYATQKRFEHTGQSIADQPTARAAIANMRIKTDMARCLWLDTLTAIEEGRADVMLRVLETKAAAGATALEVVALGMEVCGGSAYRRDVGVDRYFRDAQAANVMAPTTTQLRDFIGKAVCGLPLF